MEEVRVELGERGYSIMVGTGLLEQIGTMLRERKIIGRVLVVTNPTVAQWYLQPVISSIDAAGYSVETVSVPDGEEYKTLEQANLLYNTLIDRRYDRQSVVVALGGGVIGDLVGFVAATYLRGVRLVQIPTTLLAQVDASVGGKVAVNHPQGKNLIGSFHQPQLVISDVTTLKTLPNDQFSSGMAEVIKHGIILDADYYSRIFENIKVIIDRVAEQLTWVVADSCRIKAEIVRQDEKETNVRAVLNFGHTIGHAMESVTNFTYYKHGEAVALGMLAAIRIAECSGVLSDDHNLYRSLLQFCLELKLPTTFPELDVEQIFEAIYLDKKVESGEIHWVLPVRIGQSKITNAVSRKLVIDILRKMGGK